MAILIVDDEESTRQSLRTLLEDVSDGTILEAKNGEEALKILDAKKQAIRFIISDREMPYMDGLTLLKSVNERPTLTHIPFILILSEYSKSKLIALQTEVPRLDFYLQKPFRKQLLIDAMSEAYRHRAATRSTLVLLGASNVSSFAQTLQNLLQHSQKTFWNTLVCVSEFKELPVVVEKNLTTLGAFLIDPQAVTPECQQWLTRFRKDPHGGALLYVSLSRKPALTHAVRNLAQIFFEQEGAIQKDIASLLQTLESRVAYAWRLELAIQKSNEALKKQNFTDAKIQAETLLKLDPQNSDAQNIMGEISEKTGKTSEALKYYNQARLLNPCSPRAYLKIMGLMQQQPQDLPSLEILNAAITYCPDHLEILIQVAKIFKQMSQTNQVTSLVERIKKISPKNPVLGEFA